MAFDPRARRLWLTEGGPDCNDELNLVLRGRNYGWGPKSLASGTPCRTPPPPPLNTNQDGPNPTLPKLWWAAALTPTGAAFCDRCGLGRQYEGRLLVGNWKYKSHPLVPGSIRSITLNATRDGVVAQSVVFTSKKVVLSVERGPSTGRVVGTGGAAVAGASAPAVRRPASGHSRPGLLCRDRLHGADVYAVAAAARS